MSNTQFHRDNIEPEWQDLVNEFPEIFLDPSPAVIEMFDQHHGKGFPSTLENCCNLRYSAECDVGWKMLIWGFCEKMRELQQFAQSNHHEIHYKTFILKEKLGQLRDQGDFYGPEAHLYRALYQDISSTMENKSYQVCEITGRPGSLRRKPSGWVKTLCDEEAHRFGYEMGVYSDSEN